MHIAIVFNDDGDALAHDPGRDARVDVVRVAEALRRALVGHEYDVEMLPLGDDLGLLAKRLKARPPTLAVNLCESLGGDSRGEIAIPCLLDMMGIAYSGSSALALGLALHKHKAKEILRARGIPTPEFRVIASLDDLQAIDDDDSLGALTFPLIVKPIREDASAGIDFDSVVHNEVDLNRAVSHIFENFHQPALVEQYVEGREIYAAILGNHPRRVLPLTEIHFGPTFNGRPRIISYRAKWDENAPECIDSPSGPCVLSTRVRDLVAEVALGAFEALECQDYGRVDIRLDAQNRPFVIDVNPNCDLHPNAGYAKAAVAAGLGYAELATTLVTTALERHHGHSTYQFSRPASTRGPVTANRNLLPTGSRLRARSH